MQDHKALQFQIEDKLQSEGVEAQVHSFFQDGKANVAIDFGTNEDRMSRLIEYEDYVEDEGYDAQVYSFFKDGHLRVLITLSE